MISFFKSHPTDTIASKTKEFEASVGVGVEYTEEQVKNYTTEFINKNSQQII